MKQCHTAGRQGSSIHSLTLDINGPDTPSSSRIYTILADLSNILEALVYRIYIVTLSWSLEYSRIFCIPSKKENEAKTGNF